MSGDTGSAGNGSGTDGGTGSGAAAAPPAPRRSASAQSRLQSRRGAPRATRAVYPRARHPCAVATAAPVRSARVAATRLSRARRRSAATPSTRSSRTTRFTRPPSLLLLPIALLFFLTVALPPPLSGTELEASSRRAIPRAHAQSLASTVEKCFDVDAFSYQVSAHNSHTGGTQCSLSGAEAPPAFVDTLGELHALRNERGNASALTLIVPQSVFFTDEARSALADDALRARIAAVAVTQDIANQSGAALYSGGARYPQRAYAAPNRTQAGGHAWNPAGVDVASVPFPFPVLQLSPSVTNELRTLATRRGGDSQAPLAVRSRAYMFACGQNTTACLAAKTCRPKGVFSVWATAAATGNTTGLPYTMVAAPRDTQALFGSLAIGASAEMSSLVALLAMARGMDKFRQRFASFVGAHPMRRRPVFAAFDAETWGLSGSTRFLQDIEFFECAGTGAKTDGEMVTCSFPYMPSLAFRTQFDANATTHGGIESVLVLDHVGAPNTTSRSLVAFGDNALSRRLVALSGGAVRAASPSAPPPPVTTMDSFLRYNSSIVPVLLGDYNDTRFSTRVFHSEQDRFPSAGAHDTVSTLRVCSAAQSALLYLLEQVYTRGDGSGSLPVNASSVNQLIPCDTLVPRLYECFNGSRTCSLANDLRPGRNATVTLSGNNAAGATSGINFDTAAFFIRDWLAFHLRIPDTGGDNTSCTSVLDCRRAPAGRFNLSDVNNVTTDLFCLRGKCVAASSFLHRAYSPGIEPQSSGNLLFRTNFSTAAQRSAKWASLPRTAFAESTWFGNRERICGRYVVSDAFDWGMLGGGVGAIALTAVAVLTASRFAPAAITGGRTMRAVSATAASAPLTSASAPTPADGAAVGVAAATVIGPVRKLRKRVLYRYTNGSEPERARNGGGDGASPPGGGGGGGGGGATGAGASTSAGESSTAVRNAPVRQHVRSVLEPDGQDPFYYVLPGLWHDDDDSLLF